MLVVDGPRIYLREMQGTVPGFTVALRVSEVGESAEDTVRREVKEEVDLDVGAIRYHKSQSLPFPSQLMLGLCRLCFRRNWPEPERSKKSLV